MKDKIQSCNNAVEDLADREVDLHEILREVGFKVRSYNETLKVLTEAADRIKCD